jgi:flagellar protein FlaG
MQVGAQIKLSELTKSKVIAENNRTVRQESEVPKQEKVSLTALHLNENKDLSNTIGKVNHLLEISHYRIKFKIDSESGRLQVKLIDDESNETIREIPPDEMLNLSARIKGILESFDKLIGVFVDELV